MRRGGGVDDFRGVGAGAAPFVAGAGAVVGAGAVLGVEDMISWRDEVAAAAGVDFDGELEDEVF